MRQFLLLPLAILLLLITSCKKDSNHDSSDVGTPITIGLSSYSVDYETLNSKSMDSGDLAAVQIYNVSGGVATAYANGLFKSLQNLTFIGVSGATYRVVVTVVRDAESVISSVSGVYGRPFESAVTAAFNYSDVPFTYISEGGAQLAADNTLYEIPNIDRYYCVAEKQVTTNDKSIAIYLKRVSFGVSNKIVGVDGDFTIGIDGAPIVSVESGSGNYTIYTFANIVEAYEYDETVSPYEQSMVVTITSAGDTLLSESVPMRRNQAAVISLSGGDGGDDGDTSKDGSFDVEFEDGFDEQIYTVTFEDEAGSTTWFDQVQSSQEVSNMTELTTWSDAVTGLSGGVNMWGESYMILAGGSVVSMHYCDIALATSSTIYSVPMKDSETDGSGNDGSRNFIVLCDGTANIPTVDNTILSFANGVESTIKSLYVANTSYVCSEWDKLETTSSDWFKVTFVGYDASGNETGAVEQTMTSEGVMNDCWSRLNMSPLGKVNKIKVKLSKSIETDSFPYYIAVDDIKISM